MRRRNPTAKTHLGVTGKMNEQDAGIVGKRLANAALIVALSSAGLALAALVAAIPWEHILR